MDHAGFDALARSLGGFLDRRAMLGILTAGGVAAVTNVELTDAKKKKKKCKKPRVKCKKKCCAAGQICSGGKCAAAEECDFVKTATEWTLQADCTITKTIEIPDGVTLNGTNKTITMSGPESGFEGAGILAKSGSATVKNVTLVPFGPESECGVPGISFDQTAGSITDVTVTETCAIAIFVSATGGQAVTLTRVSVEVNGDAIVGNGTGAAAGVQLDIDDASVVGTVWVLNATGSVTNSTITGANGVLVDAGSNCTVDGNEMEVAQVGVAVSDGSTAVVTDNTIVGDGPVDFPNNGVSYGAGTAGTVSGNAISNFFDSDAGRVACGILLDAGATSVTLGSNTFPDPPSNEQNVCDNRP